MPKQRRVVFKVAFARGFDCDFVVSASVGAAQAGETGVTAQDEGALLEFAGWVGAVAVAAVVGGVDAVGDELA